MQICFLFYSMQHNLAWKLGVSYSSNVSLRIHPKESFSWSNTFICETFTKWYNTIFSRWKYLSSNDKRFYEALLLSKNGGGLGQGCNSMLANVQSGGSVTFRCQMYSRKSCQQLSSKCCIETRWKVTKCLQCKDSSSGVDRNQMQYLNFFRNWSHIHLESQFIEKYSVDILQVWKWCIGLTLENSLFLRMGKTNFCLTTVAPVGIVRLG